MRNRITKYVSHLAEEYKRPISVCLFGFGKTNKAIYDILQGCQCVSEITVRQSAGISDTLPNGVRLIDDRERINAPFEDLIFASPSVRREKLRVSKGSIITSDTELFFDGEARKSFLVSGSDGKSTVTTLSSLLLLATFPDIFVGGNIGVPLAEAPLTSSLFVLEMSSFNLRYLTPHCERAALTNITPNHLDWHDGLSEYEECKVKLLDGARETVLNLDSPRLEEIARKRKCYALISIRLTHGEISAIYKTEHTVTAEDGKIAIDGKAILSLEEVGRKERHNLTNLMLAIGLSLGYTTEDQIRRVAAEFSGLEHRCEIMTVGGIDYINSSIDTTPDRTKTTLTSLDKRVNIILGGRGKGLPLDTLKSALEKYADRISLYGEVKEEVYAWLCRELPDIPCEKFDKLSDAIDHAMSGTKVGDTVLLSPAATSYGEFKDYTKRGEYFKEYIRKNA